jgi:hypothetical protein
VDDPREMMARIRMAAAVWDQQANRRRTDDAIGNLLRAVAQFPSHREPTAHERMIVEAALELADAVLGDGRAIPPSRGATAAEEVSP